jgi:hypothetical protein
VDAKKGLRSLAAIAFLALVGALGADAAPSHAASLGFFSTTAQVIPVTFLVLVLEARFFGAFEVQKPKDFKDGQRVFILLVTGGLTIFVMLGGEFAALHPLATGNPHDGDCKSVYSALALGFGAVVLLLFFRPRSLDSGAVQVRPATHEPSSNATTKGGGVTTSFIDETDRSIKERIQANSEENARLEEAGKARKNPDGGWVPADGPPAPVESPDASTPAVT